MGTLTTERRSLSVDSEWDSETLVDVSFEFPRHVLRGVVAAGGPGCWALAGS